MARGGSVVAKRQPPPRKPRSLPPLSGGQKGLGSQEKLDRGQGGVAIQDVDPLEADAQALLRPDERVPGGGGVALRVVAARLGIDELRAREVLAAGWVALLDLGDLQQVVAAARRS